MANHTTDQLRIQIRNDFQDFVLRQGLSDQSNIGKTIVDFFQSRPLADVRKIQTLLSEYAASLVSETELEMTLTKPR